MATLWPFRWPDDLDRFLWREMLNPRFALAYWRVKRQNRKP